MRTFGVTFSFVSSPETEKERFLYSTQHVASNFFPRHGLLTLPASILKFKEYCIVIPEIAKELSQDYWKDAAWGGQFMPKKITSLMRNEVKDIEFNPVNPKIVLDFEKRWEKIQFSALTAIQRYFPKEINWIGSVEVRITKIGSIGSHYLLNRKAKQSLVINLRNDANYKDIISLLILALLYPQEKDLGLSFTKRQAVRNFILTRNEFKKIFPEFSPNIFDQPKIPVELKRKSDEYIKYLGIPNIVDPIKIINENISIFGQKEMKIVNKLINDNGEILTYDNIADLIWGEGEFKSYWAINKLVQRIQKKINSLNINLKIKGVRGVGYKI